VLAINQLQGAARDSLYWSNKQQSVFCSVHWRTKKASSCPRFLFCLWTPTTTENTAAFYYPPVIWSEICFPPALLLFWRSPSLLASSQWAGSGLLILQHCWCQPQSSRCQNVWVDILWMCEASTTHWNGTQLAPQGSAELYCLFFFFLLSCNISSYIVLSHLPPAIYNYDARGEEELSLQIGDTVHILETHEGEHMLTDDTRDQHWHANVGHYFPVISGTSCVQ